MTPAPANNERASDLGGRGGGVHIPVIVGKADYVHVALDVDSTEKRKRNRVAYVLGVHFNSRLFVSGWNRRGGKDIFQSTLRSMFISGIFYIPSFKV